MALAPARRKAGGEGLIPLLPAVRHPSLSVAAQCLECG